MHIQLRGSLLISLPPRLNQIKADLLQFIGERDRRRQFDSRECAVMSLMALPAQGDEIGYILISQNLRVAAMMNHIDGTATQNAFVVVDGKALSPQQRPLRG
jgi:hypothetical protein